jgi:hypothetical protein
MMLSVTCSARERTSIQIGFVTKGMLNYGLALLRGSGGVKAKDLQGVRPLLDLLLFVKGGLSRSFGVGAEVCSVVTLAFADQHSADLV